ncbi:MAG: hypothetical protein A2541_00250 [Candidatus Taylorbacteria bacterium RIFOXYD2_FULL_36_9]|uniref:Peptidase S11 D-alanyl-D-alanine carboxypeptidase A N-terminal domain-containing protein n=1 Tax=Candidatus Taylorbacteria bacterium RIFOXYD2_FULL_36_9 TaxID=1802338 RepID=A0A1G2PFW4_9BACT|nr:MAG: hypothetical protein A2541_00250 [Candidatus Taylorbacteria bacterium RIFOXYD2_FULL_36_9]
MTLEILKKEKILALLTVFFLFLFVGSLLFLIGVKNREKNQLLRSIVLQQKKEKEILQKMEQIKFATSTLPEISSQAFLTLVVAENGSKKILIQKNPDFALPIASLTKLMTAVVVLENVNLETKIKATTDFVGLEESAFVLEDGKFYKVKDLLANMFISSDNDSARLLSSSLGEKNFISKMNLKAKELNLTKTNFVNVTGLDPVKPAVETNISSPNDLANLLIYIKNKYPQILKLTTNTSYNFCDINNYCKSVLSTNKLLDNKDFKFRIVGGKTGSTDLALKNLVLMVELMDDVFLINIVLDSVDNFADTLVLINQVKIEN